MVSSKWVLTAGHCGGVPTPRPPGKLGVILGAHNWAEEDKLWIRPVSKIVFHPDYRAYKDNYDHDLALMQLQTEVSWKMFPHVRPICLPAADQESCHNIMFCRQSMIMIPRMTVSVYVHGDGSKGHDVVSGRSGSGRGCGH